MLVSVPTDWRREELVLSVSPPDCARIVVLAPVEDSDEDLVSTDVWAKADVLNNRAAAQGAIFFITSSPAKQKPRIAKKKRLLTAGVPDHEEYVPAFTSGTKMNTCSSI
jgi:hypothetical protein